MVSAEKGRAEGWNCKKLVKSPDAAGTRGFSHSDFSQPA
jgi:hypothetical protein